MMIFRHKESGNLYSLMTQSWDVSRQEHHFVFISLLTGEVFNRSIEMFATKFELVDDDPQSKIIPKAPHK